MHAAEMLRTHPRAGGQNLAGLAACIEACYDCAQTCTACADACLGEPNVPDLVRCIRLNLDCAGTCLMMGQMLSRQTEPVGSLLRQALDLCAEACRQCGDECERHAHHHEHCRVCAGACRRCAEACQAMLQAVPAP